MGDRRALGINAAQAGTRVDAGQLLRAHPIQRALGRDDTLGTTADQRVAEVVGEARADRVAVGVDRALGVLSARRRAARTERRQRRRRRHRCREQTGRVREGLAGSNVTSVFYPSLWFNVQSIFENIVAFIHDLIWL